MATLKERGIDRLARKAGWTLGQYQLREEGASPQDGYYYPVFDFEGKPALNPQTHKPIKRWKNSNSSGKPKYGWVGGLDQGKLVMPYYLLPEALDAIRDTGEAWMVGGEPDNLTMHAAAIHNTFSLFGENVIPLTFVTDLQYLGVKRLYHLFDLDKAGLYSVRNMHAALLGTDIEYVPLRWPGDIGDKVDANQRWIHHGFNVKAFRQELETLPVLDVATIDLPDTPQPSEKKAPNRKPDGTEKDLPPRYYEAVEAALGVKKYKANGFSNKVLCPFHEDTHPSAEWHRDKKFLKCFQCGATGNAVETGRALNIDWHNYLDPAPTSPRPAEKDFGETTGDMFGNWPDEVALIGLYLKQPDTYFENTPPHREAFTQPRLQLILDAIISLDERHAFNDRMAVENELAVLGHAEVVTPTFLNEVVGRAGRATALNSLIEKINTAYLRRNLRDGGKTLHKLATTPGRTEDLLHEAEGVLETLQGAEEEVKGYSLQALTAAHVERTRTLIDDPDSFAGGYRTGFYDLDKLVRIYPTDLMIIAGRPGQGKSAFLQRLLVLFAGGVQYGVNKVLPPQGEAVLFTYEMSADEVVSRMIAQHSGLPLTAILDGKLTTERQAGQVMSTFDRYMLATEYISGLPIYIYDDPDITLTTARRIINRLVRKNNVKLAAFDYLGLIPVGGKAGGRSRYEEVSHIARGLKRLAQKVGIPVLAAAQLNREAANIQPELHHLKDSGEIEQSANIVIAPYRPNLQADTVKMLVLKQRNRPTGAVEMQFQRASTCFRDLYK